MFSSRPEKPKADLESRPANGAAQSAPEKEAEDRTTSLDRVVIRGLFRLTDDGELQIGGAVEGDIKCYALTILDGGCMDGNVEAERILVEGEFTGNIETEHLVIASSARVISDDVLVHDSVVLEPNAHFEGVLRRPSEASARGKATDATKPAPQKTATKPAEKEVKAAAARVEGQAVKRSSPEEA